MKGIVFRSTGSWYSVRLENGDMVDARIKGKFRLQDIKHTNPVSVGDHIGLTEENGNYVITDIFDRHNYIIRRSNNLSRQSHILASNIDQALLVVTLVSPVTSAGFIDRFIISAESFHIRTILIFNKFDLLDEDSLQKQEEILKIYRDAGYECLVMSAKTGFHLDELRPLLTGKTTMLAGHSGTGKSTMLNMLNPEIMKQRTAAISEFSNKGKHTTTFAEMFELLPGAFIIDTPGIKDFGLIHLEPGEIKEYFREFVPYAAACKFNDCKHVSEPGCAVKIAVEEGKISMERYESYLNMYHNPK
jgi:ribosome biogenesis GTPase